jgi:spermidine/putrescine transport system substrate-binding protein
MLDNSRDAIGIALKSWAIPTTTTNEAEITTAVEELKKQKPRSRPTLWTRSLIKWKKRGRPVGLLRRRRRCVDGGKPDLAYAIPKEGTNLFIDAMCVPKGSPHKKEAEQFINFLCRTDIAVKNAEEICYTTPSSAAFEELDPELKSNTLIYPPDNTYKNTETFNNLPEATGNCTTSYGLRYIPNKDKKAPAVRPGLFIFTCFYW